jgi:hypothetical protein
LLWAQTAQPAATKATTNKRKVTAVLFISTPLTVTRSLHLLLTHFAA